MEERSFFRITGSSVIQSDCELPPVDAESVLFLFGARNSSLFVLNGKRYPLYEGSFISICGAESLQLTGVTGSVLTMWLRTCGPGEQDFSLKEIAATIPDTLEIFNRDNLIYTISNAYSIYFLFLEVMFEEHYMSAGSLEIMQSLVSAMLIRAVMLQNDKHSEKPDYVLNAKRYIQEHYGEELNAQILAEKQWISKAYLQSVFRKQSGYSVNEYITRIRVERAAEMLAKTDLFITDIAFRCGFNNRQWFSRVFGRQTGMSPNAYRKCAAEHRKGTENSRDNR